MRNALSLIALITVSACVGAPATYSRPDPDVSRSGPLTTTVRAEDGPAGAGFRQPNMQQIAGLDGIIGARAEQLTASFGNARIDLAEGDARKLQFASEDCVLDIFLYPMEPGQAPIAIYAEARDPQGGGTLDQAACMRQLARP